jgi:ubiquinone/menaquinone biosynthesis C-methylase UbiE
MNEYTREVVEHYSQHRNSYRSTDQIVFPLAGKIGIRNKVILDFGCGQGIDAMKFVKLGARQVVGVDISKPMIDLAKKENSHRKIKYIKLNSKKLPLKGNQFDLVFANFVVHYLENTNQQFKEIARVLKPGGHFLAVFNCLTTKDKYINKKVLIHLGKGKSATRINVLSKSPSEIKNSLTVAGLKIVQFRRIANPDARIDPNYNNKYHFRKMPILMLARK